MLIAWIFSAYVIIGLCVTRYIFKLIRQRREQLFRRKEERRQIAKSGDFMKLRDFNERAKQEDEEANADKFDEPILAMETLEEFMGEKATLALIYGIMSLAWGVIVCKGWIDDWRGESK